ncbi:MULTISPECIES: iron uptake protein [Variovorax]|jgi:hypothetical protein|uniref:iron uptake protein n=1 Tax=Variovorax TaxID=34072 RepID=UPI0008F43FE7|nr:MULTISPECIES: iron uptake protein [unclassified Variovorax]QRF61455.1 iron uptake protein [Variovorax paradoxus]TAJ58856.1 MAG: iron uptake protein [Variovorax sp.]SFO94899.1 hypothetical protein SAMN05443579_107294 [Variovorax sp. PDC80]
MAQNAVPALQIVSRIGAAVLGGYAFSWGFVALGIGLLFAAGMPFHDAESLASMLAFLVFLVAFLWAFSAANIKRVWLVLAGGGLSMTAAASLVQRALL